jgi:hypothetical protein
MRSLSQYPDGSEMMSAGDLSALARVVAVGVLYALSLVMQVC